MDTKKSLMFSSASVLLAALIFPASTQASPLVSIGDNTDVFFDGSSSLRWASNVFRDETDEIEDLLWTISPGLEINIGRGVSNADLSITTRYDFLRYTDNDQLDTELFHIRGAGSYRSSRLDLSSSASFDERQTTTGDVNVAGGLIESEQIGAGVEGEYRVSPKLSLGSGVRYGETTYTSFTDRLADREYFTVPVDIFYELTPKVDLSLGYAYTDTSIEGTLTGAAYDTEGHFFNVGARGDLLPKLVGFFKVGYRMRSADGRADAETLGLDADLSWAATPKLTAKLGLSRDFGVGGEGRTTVNTSAKLGASYSINTNWSAQANAGYTLREYQNSSNREDGQYNSGVRLTYSPNQYWSLGGGYNYSENDSNMAGSSYVNHTLDLSASLRY